MKGEERRGFLRGQCRGELAATEEQWGQSAPVSPFFCIPSLLPPSPHCSTGFHVADMADSSNPLQSVTELTSLVSSPSSCLP